MRLALAVTLLLLTACAGGVHGDTRTGAANQPATQGGGLGPGNEGNPNSALTNP